MAAKKAKAAPQGGRKKHKALPQPPIQQTNPVSGNGGQGGGYQYDPTLESQINQPYQDVMAAGNMQQLPQQYSRMNQQGQMGNIYGGTAAGSLGQYGQMLAPNAQIMGGIGNEIQGIQAGKLDVDPAQVQQIQQQQRDLQSQLQRQLGPDWATSSAGIEAMGRFQQGANTSLATANYNRLLGLVNAQQGGMLNLANVGGQTGGLYGSNTMDLYNQNQGMRQGQLTGAGQMLANTGTTQGLYANIPNTMGQFGQAMSGQGSQTMGATAPYQQDRFGQFQAQQFPTSGQFMGQMMGQSGDRWAKIGSSIGGMGQQTQ